MVSVDDLLLESAGASEPMLVARSKTNVGGVDPLGLREINFDLMNLVLPGLNNVADKIRPFVLMAWAWRRVRQVVERGNQGGATDEQMRDFVDRIEAIYAWSQFLVDPKTGIPGGQALADLIIGANVSYRFGGEAWLKRRDLRRSSTGLISPLNYGPGLRSMGWLIPVATGVFQPDPALDPMLDAFELDFEDILDHEAFNRLGEVTVDREDARRWGAKWRLDTLTEDERSAALVRLAGAGANADRSAGLELVVATAAELTKSDFTIQELREAMARGEFDRFLDPAIKAKAFAWRALQSRQLFRLALEAMLHWVIGELIDGPLGSEAIAQRFVRATNVTGSITAKEWLTTDTTNPVALLHELDDALRQPGLPDVPDLIRQSLAFCLSEPDGGKELIPQAGDRLPISRAKSEFASWAGLSPSLCIAKILEVWLFAQHTYWCVGRGLADARGRGKTLLRLRVVIDEGGWTLTPGVRWGEPPVPTPDRLATALSLMVECGRV